MNNKIMIKRISFVVLLCCLGGQSLSDDCEVLRQENSLLRELLAVQNSKTRAFSSVQVKTEGLTPTLSPTFVTSTYKTLATLPISTELLITLYGQAITTTIVEFETKETIGTTIIPTSVLAYPKAGETIKVDPIAKPGEQEKKVNPSPSAKVPEIVATQAPPAPSKTLATQPKRPVVRRPLSPPTSKRPSFGRQTSRRGSSKKAPSFVSKTASRKSFSSSSPRSFSLTSSQFPGFQSGGFKSRFKREIISYGPPEVELVSSMEDETKS